MAEISSPRRSLKASPTRSILNAQLWQHYVRNEHGACLLLIERELRAFGGQSEFPLYVKGCIERQRGRLTQSLQLFQAATCLNPRSVANLKQVGRGLYLIGKFRHALEVYDEAKRIAPEDWQVWHNVGCCHAKLSAPDEAMDAFRMADSMGHHDVTYTQMASLHVDRGDFDAAIDVLLDAADFTAQNADILTRIGLLYLRLRENEKAFEFLAKALEHDPAHTPAILAAGSISQDRHDPDAALRRYRVAAPRTPHSAQLWTNIAMCYFAKGKLIAAAACLKRALYLSPLEWIISYDLGLVYLSSGQYATAFEFIRASINLKPDFAPSFMYLGVALAKLNNFESAKSAYDQAITMQPGDHLFHLNYAISLTNAGRMIGAAEQWALHNELYAHLDAAAQGDDADVATMRTRLEELFAK